ncbi:MAG TPA: class I SAM-dependent methyltransferase [Smithellaceae bacterium]|nr:class I SAM-dependent methyltransferase [Smithellaceae bacterium]
MKNIFSFIKNLPAGINYELRRLLFSLQSRKEQFTTIYKEGGFGGSPSLSGVGSTLENTESLRFKLPELIKKYSINSILDIPCGDMYWMRHIDLGNIQYMGGDIVDDIIQANQKNFGNVNTTFKVLDLVQDELPRVDLILCRDCFIHLKLKDILSALANIKNSGSKYLLVSTYIQCNSNHELGIDFWRPINLRLQPFNLPEPLEIIEDGPIKSNEPPDKCLALYKIEDLPTK